MGNAIISTISSSHGLTSLIARFTGPIWGRQDPGRTHVGPMTAGPRWAPCWLHWLCYLGWSTHDNGITLLNSPWERIFSLSMALVYFIEFPPWHYLELCAIHNTHVFKDCLSDHWKLPPCDGRYNISSWVMIHARYHCKDTYHNTNSTGMM